METSSQGLLSTGVKFESTRHSLMINFSFFKYYQQIKIRGNSKLVKLKFDLENVHLQWSFPNDELEEKKSWGKKSIKMAP